MRVLILNSVCCWRKSNDPFTFLGEKLAARGVDVRHIVGGGEACGFYGTLADWTDEKCLGSQERAAANIKAIGNPVRNIRSFETPAMREAVDAWWVAQEKLRPEERRYKGFRIRDVIRASVARHIRRPLHPDPRHPGGEEDSTADERAVSHRMARAAALTIEIAESALDDIQPDVLLVFNGYFYVEWLFASVAKRRGIRVVAHEIACFANRMFFDASGVIGNRHSLSSQTLHHKMDSEDLNDQQRQALEAFLRDIYEGRVNNIAQAASEDIEALRARLKIPHDKKLILQIGQVAYDTVMIYDSGTFPTSLDYLRAGIEAARQIPGSHLIIRLHPHEVPVNNNWTLRQIENWDLPPNVTIVHSREANTYQLMELADCGLATTSQAGLEMAARGKPVVVTGNAFYSGHGFTLDVTRHEDLHGALEKALAAGKLDANQQRRLDIFLHHHIFEYLVPFDTEHDRFSDEAIDCILKVMDPIGGSQYRARPEISRTLNIIANPDFERNTDGWKAAGGSIERVGGDHAPPGCDQALKVASGGGAWNGVLYACEKTNQCDNQALPCRPLTRYAVSVTVKGWADFEGVTLQLHVIGGDGENFGTSKIPLSEQWQDVSLNITTKETTHHLGLQVVKVNNPQPAVFLVGNARALTTMRQGESSPSIITHKPETFPRLLVIDEVPFGNHTGYGVTMTNLLRGWPRERLAEIYRMIDYEPDMSVGMHHLPLFDTSRDAAGKQWPKGLRQLEYPLKLKMGRFDVHEHGVNIGRALKWIKPFNPQVIFTSPVTYATSRFALEMSRKLNVPYICHVMDDWLAHWEAGIRPDKPHPNEPQRQARRNKLTHELWAKASGREVISSLMADEYRKRYGYDFEILHNAIDLRQWDLGPRDYTRRGNPFRVLYTGAIWWNIQMPTLKMAADTIAELAAAGHNIRLEIYTHPSFEKQYAKQLARPPHVDFYGLVPYEQMPRLMHEADALLVPVTFDEKMFVYARCSMPTKIPECMVSGTPVVLYGPPAAAPVDYALRDDWGLVIPEPDPDQFKRRLLELMESAELRRRVGEPARRAAREHHDLEIVREAFWNRIKATASGKKPF